MKFETTKGSFLIIDLKNHLSLKILYNSYLAENSYIETNFGHFTGRQKELSKNYHKINKVSMKKFSNFLKFFDKEFKKQLIFVNAINEMGNYYWSLIVDCENTEFKKSGISLLNGMGIENFDDLIIVKHI